MFPIFHATTLMGGLLKCMDRPLSQCRGNRERPGRGDLPIDTPGEDSGPIETSVL